MKKLLASVIYLTASFANPLSFAGEKADDDEEDASYYMLNLSGAQNISSTTSIRVKIFPHERDYLPHGKDTLLDQFTVRSENPCTVYKAAPDRIASKGILHKDQLTLTIRASELAGGMIIDCPEQFTLERNTGEAKKELSYSGLLYVHTIKKQDQLMLEAINLLSLRGYLRGVVPSEVFRHWPMEALKSQAVAARTYAVYHVVRAKRFVPNRLWDVDDTVVYQAYTGTTNRSESTDEAVFATEGQILTYKGQVIQAFYHADSGGSTEEATTIWEQPAPFTVSRPEASDLEMNRVVWERRFDLKEVTEKLREAGEWTSDRPIARIVVPMVGQTTNGRVRSVALIDSKGTHVVVSTRTFKRAAGNLPSNLFTLERGSSDAEIKVKGLGWGHGVGMSQQGAAALAGRKNWTYRQILDYYYVRTSLCSIDTRREGVPDCTSESIKYIKQVVSR